MNKLLIAFALPAALAAQQSTGMAFQNVFTSGGEGGANKTVILRPGPGKPVLNRPLMATEERHSLQTLGDGTRIETKTTDKFYRDDQGRTRVERENGTVLIEDPVAGASAEISGNGKMVRMSKYNNTGQSNFSYSYSNDYAVGLDKQKQLAEAKTTLDRQVAKTVTANVEGAVMEAMAKEAAAKSTKVEARKEENLGVQSTNGILADGTRSTTTIPLGQIGNDRPIDIVSERWYSTDLQMLIKSVNKDPRFGETTYELNNIQQGAPDPSLFKLPAGRLGDSVR